MQGRKPFRRQAGYADSAGIASRPARKGEFLRMKIGFIDYYLDEWHANNYPAMISRLSGGKWEVAAAYGKIDSPNGGLTTQAWCEKMGVKQCATPEELIGACDAIVVLAPDNPETHWELCQKPLTCGKRVFVDKTFAPDAKTARALFDLAGKNAMYSTSSLRYADELLALPEGDVDYISACGPGHPENYLVHQVEPIVAVMKQKALQVRYEGTGLSYHFDLLFEGGRRADFTLFGDGPYTMTVKYRDGKVSSIADMTGFWDRFTTTLLHFFETGEGGVPREQTITVAQIIEACLKSMDTPGQWVNI